MSKWAFSESRAHANATFTLLRFPKKLAKQQFKTYVYWLNTWQFEPIWTRGVGLNVNNRFCLAQSSGSQTFYTKYHLRKYLAFQAPPLWPTLKCSINGCPLLRVCVHGVCVCVCSLLCVCVCTLDGLNAEHKFWVCHSKKKKKKKKKKLS